MQYCTFMVSITGEWGHYKRKIRQKSCRDFLTFLCYSLFPYITTSSKNSQFLCYVSTDILALSSSSILLLFTRKNWSTIQSKNSAYLPWCSFSVSCFLTPSLRKESNPLRKFSMAQQKRGHFIVLNFKQKGCNCKFESLRSGPWLTLRPPRRGLYCDKGCNIVQYLCFHMEIC